MSCSEDSYDYESYALEFYEEFEGPPLIKKKSRLIAAVVQNQVDILRDLLDSPKWYNVKDKWGYSLLQIAILRDNKEVFDYMMSLPDFPLEFTNEEGQTAFVVSLCCFVSNDIWMSEHFAYELVKKGACIDKVCYDATPLLCALERSYIRVTKLLLEAGVNVNVLFSDGGTPLDLALTSDDVSEAVTALLIYGAEPSFEHFRFSVINEAPFLVQESLFLYLCDKFSKVEMDLYVLLKLASTQSPLFHEIIKFPLKVNVSDNYVYTYFRALCSMSIDSLKMIIENFKPYISAIFSGSVCSDCFRYAHHKVFSIDNLAVMIDSQIRTDIITFINTLNSVELFTHLINDGSGESHIEELYCFLLSYGLNIDEMDLQLVYQKYGYCKVFKILLHMDIKMGVGTLHDKSIMPIFIYDVSMNLEKFLANPYNHETERSMDELFRYFAHPKLREMHDKLLKDETVSIRTLPQIPLLVELSRNAFRKFFIEKFQITTSRKFFTLLNRLPISTTHKRIITFETDLY